MKNKILLFTRNGIIGHLILQKMLPALIDMGLSPILVNTGEPESKGVPPCKELKDIGFYETHLLKNITFPFLDELSEETLSHETATSLKNLSKLYKLEYFETGDFNQPYFVEFLSKRTDIIGGVSFRILTIFKQELIDLFHDKHWFMWNLHTGILPEYRGVHIPFRAMHNKEKYYGYTLHEIDRGIDTGNIIQIVKAPIDYTKPVLDGYLQHIDSGAEAIVHSVQAYMKDGSVPSQKQDTTKQNYYSFPTAADFAQYNQENIHFMRSPNTIINMYLDYFAPQGCAWRQDLQRLLIQSVVLHENPIEAEKQALPATKKAKAA